MKIIITIFFLLAARPSFSQTPYIDTLKNNLLSHSIPDTQRVLLLADLAAIMAYVRPDSALAYAQAGMNLAREKGFEKGTIYCKSSMGTIMWLAGEYTKADELFLEALKFAKGNNIVQFEIDTYRSLSANTRDQGNYQQALDYSYQAIELAKSPQFRNERLGLCYLETGAIFQEMSRLDSALYYLQRVTLPKDINAGYIGFKYLMIGRTYLKMGNPSLALKYYQLSISALAGTNNYKDVANANNSIAELYKQEGKTDSSIYYAKKGFDIARDASFKKGIYETSLLLSDIYERKDPARSLDYFKIATAAKDSMFSLQKTMQFLSMQFNDQIRIQEEEAARISYRNKIRTYALLGAVGFFLLLAIILYRNNMHKQKAKVQIEKAYEDLKSAQAQLIQSEKMASLGELTAGIAHEIQNPLNFVNNFSELNTELIGEMKIEIEKGNIRDLKTIALDIKENEQKITYHGKRADSIVKGMLQHSRSSSGIKEPVDINALAGEYLRLSYNGLRARDKTINVTIETDFDKNIGKINIIPQDMGRVLLNLFANAFYAVSEKNARQAPGTNVKYNPALTVSTKAVKSATGDPGVLISIRDNGPGIRAKIIDKVFQPFFTTKPTGQGTGLGLSLSYDIIKAHGGEIKIETKENEGTVFIIYLPA